MSKHDATAVQRQLEGELFDKWDESSVTMDAKGILIKDLSKFLDRMVGAFEGNNTKGRLLTSEFVVRAIWF